MPSVHFRIEWPDGTQAECYSPSTIVHDYLASGQRYTLVDFVERARSALHAGSERVRAKYGYTCSAAMDQLARIEHEAQRFASDPQAAVTIIELSQERP